MAQDVAILDFGSGKITVFIGSRGVNNTVCINGIGECDYAGFGDGEWYDPEQICSVVGHAISKAETNSCTKVRHLYIGVPGEFTITQCKEVSISLSKNRKITDYDVDALHDQGVEFSQLPDYQVINSQPIYYNLDDERRLIQPVGLTSTKLSGLISYILAEKKFTKFIDKIMASVHIESFVYVSSVLAETLFLFDEIKRDQFVILVDVGYITSTVILARGDGILSMNYFDFGGGHVTGALAIALEIPYSQAESLKRKVVLSLNVSEEDVYEISERGEVKKFKAKLVNEIVSGVIDVIASTIEKCLKRCVYEYPDYIPYYITGGGLCYLKGARDYLSKRLDKPVEIVAPSLPQFNRPHLSSSLGLLDMVLSQQMPEEKKGFFAKLFKKR